MAKKVNKKSQSKKSKWQRGLKKTTQSIRTAPSRLWAWIKDTPTRIKRRYKLYKKRKAYKSFHLQKKIKSIRKPLPSSWQIFKDSWRFLVKNWRTMFVLLALYSLIYVIFLAPNHTFSVTDIQSAVDKLFGDNRGLQYEFTKASATIGMTLLDSGQTSAATVITGIVMSLIFIWAIRHLTNKRKIRARDAIYQGPGPFVAFVLILLIITFQTMPALFANFLYNTAKSTQLLTTGFENFTFFAIAALVVLLCLYWATSSIIALYIVTLPGMYPIAALSQAKKLVVFRRFEVFRKIVALPFLMLIVYGIILVAIVLIKPTLLVLAINIITILTLPIFHTYMYKVYRALL